MPTSRSLARRILGVIRAPRDTFTAVARAPRWFDVLAITLLVTASTTALVLETEVGQLALLDRLERLTASFGRPPDDAAYSLLQRASQHGAAYALMTSLVGGPLLAAGLSAVLAGAFHAGGGRATFVQVLAIVSHANVILALRQVMAAPLVFVRETLATPLTLSSLLPVLDERSFIARFAASIDLLVIWWIGVLAIGMSVLYRVPIRRTAPIFVLAYVMLAVSLAILMSMTGSST